MVFKLLQLTSVTQVTVANARTADRGKSNKYPTSDLVNTVTYLEGRASEVAAVIAFLLSDDASYITSQTINIDGGLINSQSVRIRKHPV